MPTWSASPMSPAMVAVSVRIGSSRLYQGEGIWAALPEAIHTTIVSPITRMMPRMTAAAMPLLAAGMMTRMIVSARVAPRA